MTSEQENTRPPASVMRIYADFLKANAELFKWSVEIDELRNGMPGDIDLSFKEFQRWSNKVQQLTDQLDAQNFWDTYEEEPF